MKTIPTVRQRILAAAVELAQTVGLQGVSQARVATRAGVRQSHLTYYFPMRIDLIEATFNEIRDQILKEGRRASDSAGSELSSRVASLRCFFTSEVHNVARSRLFFSVMQASGEDPQLGQWFTGFEREMVTHLGAMFSSSGLSVADDELNLFHVSYVGAALLSIHRQSADALDQAAKQVGMAFDRLVASAS